ncbi:dinuclear metal center protein, YbgI/SA1388 family [Granulicatella balaenopterae]|uniref:GTP cyclohydrolase 1 type 2 homolog n=1 Tax=Granulicatella balaenopterae TaxID=137733 RepID=A0A1H9P181_9LACT|nr:Nif3-like dinuclear metal center hexameric protein [Granulicatella balaenopterae]SER41881.1 dinuclear metal center protein, YbgI/SA1388 family [Granulicatella balaenopterae]
MAITVGQFIKRFEQFAPKHYAEPKDPIGLHFGKMDQDINKIMVTLDIRPSVIEEAIEQGVDFIMAHHPPIFRPIKNFNTADPQTAMYAEIIKHDIAIYAAHTNLDIAPGGMNDWLADAIGLQNCEVLTPTHTLNMVKIAVFVPRVASEEVRVAMGKAGAGHIGDHYINCSYTLDGIGRFTPTEGANPAIGEVGKAEVVAEEKIEVVCSEAQLSGVIKAMKEVHPYEVPAYDVFPLKNGGETIGLGKIGELPVALPYEEFLQLVAKSYHVTNLRHIKPRKKEDLLVKRVAVLGGSGQDFFRDAIHKQADAYITGDISFHYAHDIQESTMAVVDPGHHIEKICIPELEKLIRQWIAEEDWTVELMKSTTYTEPFEFFSL